MPGVCLGGGGCLSFDLTGTLITMHNMIRSKLESSENYSICSLLLTAEPSHNIPSGDQNFMYLVRTWIVLQLL